jgi:Acyl-CoA thioesterase C-terminal domain/Acyl-CoA thioesterase N-terminal domain
VSLFASCEDGRVTPTEHARGPWDPRALHGCAAAALIAGALERETPGELAIGRLGFEFQRPVPFAPLRVSTEIVRNGRRVRELAAELTAVCADGGSEEPVARAHALLIQAVPKGLPDPCGRRQLPGPEPIASLPGPDHGKTIRFALDDTRQSSLATTGMQMSWLTDPYCEGPGKVWMRLKQPLVGGEHASPLVRLVATADFGNGVSRELPFDSYLFVNADLTIHLWRRPQGEWIGLDAKTVLMGGGVGTAESVLHDLHGPVARAYQTLVVEPR